MKCEICHNADAQTAIQRSVNGEEQELYVCKACARAERAKRQKRSQRTRKATGLPPGVSITVGRVGDGPPPFIGAILDAVHGMVSDLEKASEAAKKEKTAKAEAQWAVLPAQRAETPYRVADRLHLEGLFLLGEIEPVQRAMHALGLELVGSDVDGVRECGHAYVLRYTCPPERAKRVAADILEAERSARVRLFEELPRVFGDSLCRALAILKNCRLLSVGELFDILSPLRLAAIEKMLDGITLAEIEKMMSGCPLDAVEDVKDPDERDREDAERADEMNRRFEDVILNERAEEKYL